MQFEGAPVPFVFISRHGWVLFVLVTCLNGAIWWYRARRRIAETPELEPGYRRLIRGWLIYGNIPWLVMGLGILVGGVPTIWHFFNARNGPFVLAWYVSVVVLWVLSVYWLFFRGGAEALVAHPGLFRSPVQSPRAVKAYFLLALAGGITGLLMMLFGNIRVPG